MKTLHLHSQEEMDNIIKQCVICFVGMADTDGTPYVIPMNFGYNNKAIYLHSAPEGRSTAILSRNNKVCITFSPTQELVFQDEQVACSYTMKSQSVIAFGQVTFVEDKEEKVKIMNILMRQYTDKEFTYSDPAITKVKVWKIDVDQMTAKEFGASYEKYKLHKQKHT